MSELANLSEAPVLFEQLSCSKGKKIGVITLNAEKTLNALTLQMVELILERLEIWKTDNTLVCIYIKGAGQKAFCAGGDVQALYKSAIQTPGGPCEYAETFFTKEYQLDYLLHEYPKPIVCWGSGIVMGGGLGIFTACSHRVVTEKTRLAMPEVTIGLYPDVGGSWFLNKMPGFTGLFLALTGAPLNAADSIFTASADYFIAGQQQEYITKKLCELPWSDHAGENGILLDQFLEDISSEQKENLLSSNVEKNQHIINELCEKNDIYHIVDAINNINSDDDWLRRAQKTLKAGSPLSVMIIYQQLQRSSQLSLADVFRAEIILSTNIVRYPEFAEGVRALLIDKDNTPHWTYSHIQEIPNTVIDTFFVAPEFSSPWPNNPLEHL